MKRSLVIAAGAVFLSASAFAAQAEDKTAISDGVVKIGMIEDMSSIYADITGVGAVTAAKMAVEDFGGSVLGMPIEVVSADHQNKADIASATAREWFENQHVDALMDVAASATALAAIDVAKTKNKIVVLIGPGAARITNEACTPVSIHYTYDNYALAHGTGGAMVKAEYDTVFRNRRLCLWPRSRAGDRRCGQGERRAGARWCPGADQYVGFFLGLATGAVLESQSGRPC